MKSICSGISAALMACASTTAVAGTVTDVTVTSPLAIQLTDLDLSDGITLHVVRG